MTDPSTVPETPDIAETASFLRRFASLMSNGSSATQLHRAADLLEDLTGRMVAAMDEESLWRYKYETVTSHADALETECEMLKHDIDGHLNITTTILSERDALMETAKAQGDELEQLRLAFDRERAEFQIRLKASADEVEALRVASRGECDELRAKVAALETERTELRSAVERISDLGNQPISDGSLDRPLPRMPVHTLEGMGLLAQRRDPDLAVGAASAVVSRTALHQARAQFEYLGRECIPRGDIASQVMCELGAHTMDLALTASGATDILPVGELARSILAPPRTTSLAADTM